MAENKTQPTDADVDAFIDDVDLDVLRELVRRSVEHVAASHDT